MDKDEIAPAVAVAKAPRETISEIYLTRGKVFVKAAPDVLDMDLRLDCAGLAQPFSRVRGAIPDLCVPFQFDLLPADIPGHKVVINKLVDWFADGVATAQVCLHKPDQPQRIPIAAPMLLAPHRDPALFEAEIACHRALAELCLTVRQVETDMETKFSILFDQTKTGGTTLDLFQKVRFVLPPSDENAELSLQVNYRAMTTQDSTQLPYVFVAQPRISLGNADPLVVPVAIVRGPVPGAIWLEADLPSPRFRAGETAVVAFGDTSIPVFTAKPCEIFLDADHGHFLEFRASEAGSFALWINGAPVTMVSLGPATTGIRIPSRYLTGTYGLLQIFDPSGTQLHWSDWIFLPRILTSADVLLRESHKPYPLDLFPQSQDRNRALRAHVAAGSGPAILGQLEQVLDALEAGHDRLKLRPLAFPKVARPLVSVVIPAHNKVKVTYACLAALLLAHNMASFEVILVDDASTDETATIEKIVSGITLLRNAEPQRFIRACNAGVAAARGTYVVLLNNDTEPTAGWLDELIAAFGRFENVGLVGSKLLYPDGMLQDAGGIVWGSGNPWNYGMRQNPWEPRFCYARQADYLSGAAMMTTRAIWDKVGGLSSYLEPMYFEDTDFAFKIREAGYSTWFVPSSVVYHYEGMTSGTDGSKGFKRYQEINRPKFKRRWSHACAAGGKEGVEPDLAKDRGIVGRVLFIDYKAPTPDMDAGSYAAVQEIRLVQSLGYKVTFMPENLAHMGSRTTDLEKMGVEMIVAPFYPSIDDFLDERAGEFDAVYVTRFHVANNVVQKIRAVAPQARILMNNADLHFLRTLRAALAANDPVALARVPDLRRDELEAMTKVDLVLSYNEVEHSVIQSHTDGRVKVMKCPWVVDCPETVPPRDQRKGISFLGSFTHHPNAEGIEWFSREVMGQLEATRPDTILSIYGSGMDERISKLRSAVINPVGFIENADDAYDGHLVFVAPLLSGAGIKGKVLSALARGTPCVLSPVAAEGIGLRDGTDCLIAQKPEDWQRATLTLHDDADLWKAISDNGRALARSRFSFAQARQEMRQAFEAVDLFRSKP